MSGGNRKANGLNKICFSKKKLADYYFFELNKVCEKKNAKKNGFKLNKLIKKNVF